MRGASSRANVTDMCERSRQRSTRESVTGRHQLGVQNDDVMSRTPDVVVRRGDPLLCVPERVGGGLRRRGLAGAVVAVGRQDAVGGLEPHQWRVPQDHEVVGDRVDRRHGAARTGLPLLRTGGSREAEVGVALGHLVMRVPAHDDQVDVLQLLDQRKRVVAPDVAGAIRDVALPDPDGHVLRRAGGLGYVQELHVLQPRRAIESRKPLRHMRIAEEHHGRLRVLVAVDAEVCVRPGARVDVTAIPVDDRLVGLSMRWAGPDLGDRDLDGIVRRVRHGAVRPLGCALR